MRKLRRGLGRRCSVALGCVLVPVLVLLLIIINSYLPEFEMDNERSYRTLKLQNSEIASLCKLGSLMVEMLPDDLAFTIFVPSEQAFQSILHLRASDGLMEDKLNDTSAILSRIMGFSAIARHVSSASVHVHKEVVFDSVSGFSLYIWKSPNGNLVVNNIHSKLVDLRKGEIIVHIISGVLMDAEFEESFTPDYEG